MCDLIRYAIAYGYLAQLMALHLLEYSRMESRAGGAGNAHTHTAQLIGFVQPDSKRHQDNNECYCRKSKWKHNYRDVSNWMCWNDDEYSTHWDQEIWLCFRDRSLWAPARCWLRR